MTCVPPAVVVRSPATGARSVLPHSASRGASLTRVSSGAARARAPAAEVKLHSPARLPARRRTSTHLERDAAQRKQRRLQRLPQERCCAAARRCRRLLRDRERGLVDDAQELPRCRRAEAGSSCGAHLRRPPSRSAAARARPHRRLRLTAATTAMRWPGLRGWTNRDDNKAL